MTAIVILHIEIDDAQPLGPQIEAARAVGVPWKVIEEKLGHYRQFLEYYTQRAPRPRALCELAKDTARAAPPKCARSAG